MSTARGIFDHENFDKGVIPAHLKRDVRGLIEASVSLGWKIHVSTANAVTLISFDERKKYHLSKRSSISYQRMFKDVVKYADPQRAALVAEGQELGLPAELIRSLLPSIEEATTYEQPESQPEPEVVEAEVVEPEPTPAPRRHVISVTTMIAKKEEGRAYDSPTTDEVLWSDGSKTYRCKHEGCDFESSLRIGPGRHWGNMHKERMVEPQTYAAEVPEATRYNPQKRRVQALADALRQAWGEEPDFEALATTALTWVHEQHGEPQPDEPLTAEQILARIRTLLDDGTAGQIRADLAAANERLVTLQAEVERERERTQQVRETLHTLAELASEAGVDTDEVAS